MIKWLLSMRIRTQLMLVITVSISVALLMAGTVVAITTARTAYKSLSARLETQARVAAINTAAAVSFDDSDAAARILRGLEADEAMVFAEVRRPNGTLLAQASFPQRQNSGADEIEARADIMLPQKIGVVVLHATTKEVDA